MSVKNLWRVVTLMVAAAMILAACAAPTAAPEPTTGAAPEAPSAPPPAAEEVGGFQIPEIEEGKFNVAMVLIGPHDDGGWSEAHWDGLNYIADHVEGTPVAYIEL